MAKRRKLEAPSTDDLNRIESEFRRETAPRGPLTAPIAQIAADSAAAHDPRPADLRAEVARDKADAEVLRDAQGRGLVMAELSIDEIDADAMVRDRVVLDAAEMDELKGSISKTGLRLPIEVYELPEPEGALRYGLLSGYRRLKAVRDLRALNGRGPMTGSRR